MKCIVMRRNEKEFSDEDFGLMLMNNNQYFDDVDFINLDDLYDENTNLTLFISRITSRILEFNDKEYDMLYIVDNQSIRDVILDIFDNMRVKGNRILHSTEYQAYLMASIINNFGGDVIVYKLKRDGMGNVI